MQKGTGEMLATVRQTKSILHGLDEFEKIAWLFEMMFVQMRLLFFN